MDNRAELAHYGVLGMKWGVRRYQNLDGTLTAEGRKRYHTDGSKAPFSEKGGASGKPTIHSAAAAAKATMEQKRQSLAERKAAKQEEKAKAEHEKNRQKALTATDPAEISKYAKYLTNEELQARIDRTRKERELTSMYSEQSQTRYFNGKKAIGEAAMNAVRGVGNGMSEVTKAATIYGGKMMIRSIFGDEVYKTMFPPTKKKNNGGNNGDNENGS